MTIGVVIPAQNEENNIGPLVHDLTELRAPDGTQLVDDIVICDNNSKDHTAMRALEAGGRVVKQKQSGYGIACLTAIEALRPVDVVVFVDGDRAFNTAQVRDLVDSIEQGADLVIGSRVLGHVERGAMSWAQRAGNRVASVLIRLIWHQRVTDLGPFRAIRSTSLKAMKMADELYGWTVEMQIKAIQLKLCVVEVPVDSFRRRSGKSKVGGTLKGVVGASLGILRMIMKLALNPVK